MYKKRRKFAETTLSMMRHDIVTALKFVFLPAVQASGGSARLPHCVTVQNLFTIIS